MDAAERFWSRVRKGDGCWLWLGGRESNGRYGACKIAGRSQGAHRWAYELTHGQIPAGLVVRHRCDNTLCCNPDHLEVGTQLDNRRDAVERQRTHRRFWPEDAGALNAMRESGMSFSAIAVRLGVPRTTLMNFFRRQRAKAA